MAHQQTGTHPSESAQAGGTAATNLEKTKHRLYSLICRTNNIALSPLGIDVFGALGEDGVDFFRRAAIFISGPRGSSARDEELFLHERFTIALHALQSRMIFCTVDLFV